MRCVCSRTPLSLGSARPRGRMTTGVGVSCSSAVSDGPCEAACACRTMRERHSSANSKVISGTGDRCLDFCDIAVTQNTGRNALAPLSLGRGPPFRNTETPFYSATPRRTAHKRAACAFSYRPSSHHTPNMNEYKKRRLFPIRRLAVLLFPYVGFFASPKFPKAEKLPIGGNNYYFRVFRMPAT